MLVLMCSIFLVVPLLFMGCGSGSDGAQGTQGIQGPPGLDGSDGSTGPAGPITSTNESCMVCHTTGRIADISDSDTASITHYNPAYNNLPMAISAVSITDNGSGNPQVSFHVASGGANVTTLTASAFRFYLSDLVPAGAVAGSTPQFERWAYEYSTSTFGTFNAADAANGNYVYTFATAFGSAAAIAEAPDYNAAHTQRLILRASLTGYNNAVGIVDFKVADTVEGSTTGLGYNERQFVTAAACKKCHGPLFAGAAHAGGYLDTLACVMCHSPIGHYGEEMVADKAWLASVIHKLHSAIPMEAFPTRIGGRGYGAVTYPQDVRDCVTCHTDSGLALGAGNQVDNWKNHPTAAACGTCHTSADFVTGTGHPGGAQPDAACSFCHPATGHVAPTLGASVTEAHDTSPAAVLHPNPKNAPEFDVAIAMSPVKDYYVAGDNVTVTVTLKYASNGTDVPGTVYTATKDSKGVSGGGLSFASLYVYGPRALPKPIFAPTDNTQGHGLFTGTVDMSGTVATDSTGFKYRFTVPSGRANGTYMIRFEGMDYGGITDTDYVTSSNALINFQVGNATVTNKVAGDACVNCHGATRMHLEGAHPHNAPFNTDHCIGCHDYSGGYAATIVNRVHAVHSANKYGDMYNKRGGPYTRDWSGVTYPQTTWSSSTGLINTQGTGRCATCHTSGNTSYRSITHEVSCLGCHGDDPNVGGATNHMLQSGGNYPVTP
jgi:hypothetical protein